MEKGLKITAIVLFFLIMGFFVFQAWLGHKVVSVIEEKGSQMNGGIYNVTVEDARVNLFGRSVRINGIVFKPDTTQTATAEPQEMILDFSIDDIYASGFNLKMIRGKQPLKLNVIEVDHPVISADIYKDARPSADTVTEAKKQTPFEFPARRVRISDGAIVLRQHDNGSHTYTEATDINVDIRERKAKNGALSGLAGYFTGAGSVSNVIMTNADASVDTIFDTIMVDLSAGNVSIAGVTVTPRYGQQEFVYKNSRHRDWTHLWARDIQITGLDVKSAGIHPESGAAKTHLTVDSIHIGSGMVESYKDRNAYQPYWVRKLIFESVSELPIMLTVEKAVIADMDAVYSELPKGGTVPGIINFTNLSGTVTGLSNVPSDQEPYWSLAAHGFIYGAAAVNATFHFPKQESTNRWEATGSLGRLDLRNLNKTITPLAKAEIESGEVDRLTFKMVGNRHSASVDLELLYHGLKVDLVKLKDNNEVKERKFISWIANEFVIKDSNPSRNGEVRHGSGTAERELDRSQFNLLWKTLAQGIKETAGL